MSEHEAPPVVVPEDVSKESTPSESNVKPVSSHSVPPPPLRTPELTASSPLVTPWPSGSAMNTTPRQSGKRFIPEDRKSSVSSRGSIASSSSNRSVAPSIAASSFVLDHSENGPTSRNYPLMVPTIVPKHPSQCSLFCCFYAEFDIKVGPKICYQSPPNFMQQDIRSTTAQWELLLSETFATHQKKAMVATTDVEGSATTTPKASGGARVANTLEPESSGGTDVLEDTSLQSYSIFDSCSEYIITGSELTGNIINLSTHHIHLVTRPTMIIDESYERNSLLFCVGFVLRRSDDPHPYQPLLSKLALTLRDMEIESQFLSQSRDQIQPLLEGILVSINSPHGECNLVLGTADLLNLKLFRPPRTPAEPVKDHSVPILLRRDWHHQAYEWDISINWVSLHIDGIANVRQISKKAEVDLEMVRACLRVLKHHGFVALVDMFCYSNRYECTECMIESKLLQEAAEYVIKRSAKEIVSSASDNAANTIEIFSGHPPVTSPLDRSGEKMDSMSLSYLKGDSYQDRLSVGAPGSSLSQSHQETPLAAYLKQDDIVQIKMAIVEFFAACHRGVSIGDLWISFVSQRLQSPSVKIDWKKMFHLIDHRRLVIYGLLHGCIRRVHVFPLLRDRKNYMDDDFEVSSVDRMKFPQYSSMPRMDLQKTMTKAAAGMDGFHCDDEIVCTVEVPIDTIISMFPEDAVVFVLSCD